MDEKSREKEQTKRGKREPEGAKGETPRERESERERWGATYSTQNGVNEI